MAKRPSNILGFEHAPRPVLGVNRALFADDSDFARLGSNNSIAVTDRAVDYLYLLPDDDNDPDRIFTRLRWGGQVVILSKSVNELSTLAKLYQSRSGFALEKGPRRLRVGPLGGRLPLVRETWFYLLARKVALIKPGHTTDRFTFHVELVRNRQDGSYAVLKRVPSYGSVMVRLKQRLPDTPEHALATRARKLVDKIFPVFLTRETAFLRLLQRDLPESYRSRVPHVVHTQRGADGLVHKLYINWMRLGTKPISQLDFALQATDLTRLLHDRVHLIHLDLRMDNIVITDEGVCFVDFGSAVRMDEDLSDSPMLNTLFTEMMSTSQIQRLLGRMKATGKVTSELLVQGHEKVDKAADLFYLAMQIANPHTNPDLNPLIEFDVNSRTAKRITRLTQKILRPIDPAHPEHSCALDILRDLRKSPEKCHNRDPLAVLKRL